MNLDILCKIARKGDYVNFKENLKATIEDILLIIMTDAIKASNVKILDDFISDQQSGLLRDSFDFIVPNLITLAVGLGKIEVLAIFQGIYDREISEATTITCSIKYNHPHIIHWYVKNGYDILVVHIYRAVEFGRLHILKWLHNKGYNPEWLRSEGSEPDYILDRAKEKEHDDVVRWLKENGY